jgi:hypothetical protein
MFSRHRSYGVAPEAVVLDDEAGGAGLLGLERGAGCPIEKLLPDPGALL